MTESDNAGLPTVISLFHDTLRKRPDEPALHWPREGQFQTLTWRQLGDEVFRMAAALRALGVTPGARVAQLAENRREWIVADLAILALRAVHVPIHTSLAGAQIAHQIGDSGARWLLVATAAQLEALAPQSEALRAVQIVTYEDFSPTTPSAFQPLRLNDLLSQVAPEAMQKVAEELAAVRPDDLATIMYTSGTVGTPKGVMLTQHNLASNAIATADAYDERPDERRVCFLPLSHIYARTCDMYTWLYRGSELALVQSRETIVADCQQLRPTLINGVPYFYEKLHRRLREANQLQTPDVLQNLLGGRLRACFCGGAGVPAQVREFFESQDLPILEGYGLSEASPVITVSTRAAHRPGAVGRPIAGAELRLAADGEILTRGPYVMQGYWQNPAATAEALREGWLHTGDLGSLDADGFLTITGRKKEMLVTAAGKKVAPAYLEKLLVDSPLIVQAMVLGEGRNYLTALIVPDPDRLRSEIRARRLWVFSRRGALRHRRVLELYRAEIDRCLAGVSRHEQIGRFALLDRGFSLELGELTPKVSLRRDVIAAHFADRIAELYSS